MASSFDPDFDNMFANDSLLAAGPSEPEFNALFGSDLLVAGLCDQVLDPSWDGLCKEVASVTGQENTALSPQASPSTANQHAVEQQVQHTVQNQSGNGIEPPFLGFDDLPTANAVDNTEFDFDWDAFNKQMSPEELDRVLSATPDNLDLPAIPDEAFDFNGDLSGNFKDPWVDVGGGAAVKAQTPNSQKPNLQKSKSKTSNSQKANSQTQNLQTLDPQILDLSTHPSPPQLPVTTQPESTSLNDYLSGGYVDLGHFVQNSTALNSQPPNPQTLGSQTHTNNTAQLQNTVLNQSATLCDSVGSYENLGPAGQGSTTKTQKLNQQKLNQQKIIQQKLNEQALKQQKLNQQKLNQQRINRQPLNPQTSNVQTLNSLTHPNTPAQQPVTAKSNFANPFGRPSNGFQNPRFTNGGVGYNNNCRGDYSNAGTVPSNFAQPGRSLPQTGDPNVDALFQRLIAAQSQPRVSAKPAISTTTRPPTAPAVAATPGATAGTIAHSTLSYTPNSVDSVLTEENYFPLTMEGIVERDPNAPKPIYQAYTGSFRTAEEARRHRKHSRKAARGAAQDVNRVMQYGRLYWVRRIYEAMIDISHMDDGGQSIHRNRFTKKAVFDPLDLEATAHKIFDRAIRVHTHGWCKPRIYHKHVVRGKHFDVATDSLELRLANICTVLAQKKATVDDAVRGGITLALLCDNPEARGSTKASNNVGNEKRGRKLKAVRDLDIKFDEDEEQQEEEEEEE